MSAFSGHELKNACQQAVAKAFFYWQKSQLHKPLLSKRPFDDH
jgi:hypothetical protein